MSSCRSRRSRTSVRKTRGDVISGWSAWSNAPVLHALTRDMLQIPQGTVTDLLCDGAGAGCAERPRLREKLELEEQEQEQELELEEQEQELELEEQELELELDQEERVAGARAGS
jgi:hypothetical protein